MSQPPGVVLDTNATLDWLVFRNPAAAGFGAAIATGRLRWLATAAMRREFDHVLARPALARWRPDAEAAAAAWARNALLADAEPQAGPLCCTDPDDQVFIDLAVHARATWLLTRDRALLALAKRARSWGIAIVTPEIWSSTVSMFALTDNLTQA